MASGKFGSAAPAANTNTTIYTVPAGMVATVNLNIINWGTTSASLIISIGAETPADEDYIEYGTILPPYGVLERSGLVMSAAESLVVNFSVATVSARAYGFEEVA